MPRFISTFVWASLVLGSEGFCASRAEQPQQKLSLLDRFFRRPQQARSAKKPATQADLPNNPTKIPSTLARPVPGFARRTTATAKWPTSEMQKQLPDTFSTLRRELYKDFSHFSKLLSSYAREPLLGSIRSFLEPYQELAAQMLTILESDAEDRSACKEMLQILTCFHIRNQQKQVQSDLDAQFVVFANDSARYRRGIARLGNEMAKDLMLINELTHPESSEEELLEAVQWLKDDCRFFQSSTERTIRIYKNSLLLCF